MYGGYPQSLIENVLSEIKFTITANTNFKKKLTSFISKSVWGNSAMKVKVVATEIRLHSRR